MEDLALQFDEIEALVAIYNDDWQIEDAENRSYSVKISDGDDYVKLYFKLPVDYPSKSPPRYAISAPHVDHAKKKHLSNLLEELYASFGGGSVMYQWTERIREELQPCPPPELPVAAEFAETIEYAKKDALPLSDDCEECPEIIHGEVIADRKSTFQGHAATVLSVQRVKQVLRSLRGNRKIAQATHNIYAYRIIREDGKSVVQDCDDDGESQAGGRLLRLLEIVGAKNVLVVVSRWYGGIHLGSDRFRHINNAARQVLENAQFIQKNYPQKK